MIQNKKREETQKLSPLLSHLFLQRQLVHIFSDRGVLLLRSLTIRQR